MRHDDQNLLHNDIRIFSTKVISNLNACFLFTSVLILYLTRRFILLIVISWLDMAMMNSFNLLITIHSYYYPLLSLKKILKMLKVPIIY